MNLNTLRVGPRLAIGFGAVLLLLLVTIVAIVAIACLQLARTASGLAELDNFDERAAIARDWVGKTQLNVTRAIAKASGRPDVENFFAPQIKQTSAEIGTFRLERNANDRPATDQGQSLVAS